jgi:hypothetical protein
MGTEPWERRVMEPPSERSLVEAMSKMSSISAPGPREVRTSSVSSVVLRVYLMPWNSISLPVLLALFYSKGGVVRTVTEKGDLLDWSVVLEEVQVHKGHLLASSVLDNSLDPRVVDLLKGNVQSRSVELDIDRRGTDALHQSKKGNGGDETHDEAGVDRGGLGNVVLDDQQQRGSQRLLIAMPRALG